MRIAAYVALVALALASVASGRLGIALAIAGAKSALVGAEYMELRHAHRGHALAFAAALLGMVIVLGGIAAG